MVESANQANNKITGVSIDGTAIINTADYEPFGPIGEWTWGNNTVSSPNKHTRYFDLDGRNTKIESGANIEPAQILYDAASRIVALQRLTLGTMPTVDQTKTSNYAYDNLDRLTAAGVAQGNPNSAQSFTYDAIGNRLSATLATIPTTYSYGTASHRLNALSSATAGGMNKTYSYDAVGNRISDGIQSWIYGGDNRPSGINIASITNPTNPTTVQNAINALGQRVSKTVTTAGVAKTTRYMYDEAGRLLGEYNQSGQALQETIWFNDLPVAVLK